MTAATIILTLLLLLGDILPHRLLDVSSLLTVWRTRGGVVGIVVGASHPEGYCPAELNMMPPFKPRYGIGTIFRLKKTYILSNNWYLINGGYSALKTMGWSSNRGCRNKYSLYVTFPGYVSTYVEGLIPGKDYIFTFATRRHGSPGYTGWISVDTQNVRLLRHNQGRSLTVVYLTAQFTATDVRQRFIFRAQWSHFGCFQVCSRAQLSPTLSPSHSISPTLPITPSFSKTQTSSLLRSSSHSPSNTAFPNTSSGSETLASLSVSSIATFSGSVSIELGTKDPGNNDKSPARGDVGVVILYRVLGSEQSGEAVDTSGRVTALLGGLISPGVATQVTRGAVLNGMIEQCAVDGAAEMEAPSHVQFPFRFLGKESLEDPDKNEDGSLELLQNASGSLFNALGMTVVSLLPVVLWLLWRHTYSSVALLSTASADTDSNANDSNGNGRFNRRTVERAGQFLTFIHGVGIFACLLAAYLSGMVLYSAAMVLVAVSQASSEESVVNAGGTVRLAGMCVGAIMLVALHHAFLVYGVAWLAPRYLADNAEPESTVKCDAEPKDPDSGIHAVLVPLVEAGASVNRKCVRVYFLLELGVADIVGLISGAAKAMGCVVAAALITASLFSYLLYLLCVRPYQRRVDTMFTLGALMIQLVQTLLSIAAIATSSSEKRNSLVDGVGYCSVLVNMLLILQLVGMVVEVSWTMHQQKLERLYQESLDNAEVENVNRDSIRVTATSSTFKRHEDANSGDRKSLVQQSSRADTVLEELEMALIAPTGVRV